MMVFSGNIPIYLCRLSNVREFFIIFDIAYYCIWQINWVILICSANSPKSWQLCFYFVLDTNQLKCRLDLFEHISVRF